MEIFRYLGYKVYMCMSLRNVDPFIEFSCCLMVKKNVANCFYNKKDFLFLILFISHLRKNSTNNKKKWRFYYFEQHQISHSHRTLVVPTKINCEFVRIQLCISFKELVNPLTQQWQQNILSTILVLKKPVLVISIKYKVMIVLSDISLYKFGEQTKNENRRQHYHTKISGGSTKMKFNIQIQSTKLVHSPKVSKHLAMALNKTENPQHM